MKKKTWLVKVYDKPWNKDPLLNKEYFMESIRPGFLTRGKILVDLKVLSYFWAVEAPKKAASDDN